MAKGSFLLNVCDSPLNFSYETDIAENRYKDFHFIFMSDGYTMATNPEQNTFLKDFLLEGTIRDRVFEQTGLNPTIIGVNVN